MQPLTSSDPLNSFSTSSLGHLRRLFTSLLFRLTFLLVTSPLVRSPFPLLHPHGWLVGWCCVGIQRPHNRLLAHSVSWNTPSPPWSPSFFLFHLFLIQPGQPCLLLLFLLRPASCLLGLLLTKVCGHPPFPRKRNESEEARKCKGGGEGDGTREGEDNERNRKGRRTTKRPTQ